MPKKRINPRPRILYHVQKHDQKMAVTDAVGQEIAYLAKRFNGKIFSISNRFTRPYQLFSKLVKSPSYLQRFFFPYPILAEKHFDLHHVYYPRLDNLGYLRQLKKPIIFSVMVKNLGYLSKTEAIRKIKKMPFISALIVGDSNDVKVYRKYFPKVYFVRSGIDLAEYKKIARPVKKSQMIRFLVASQPNSRERYASRGYDLLFDLLKKSKNIQIRFLWRENNEVNDLVKTELQNQKIASKTEMINQILAPKAKFENIDATIIPYKIAEGVKAFPNSALESLAAGRPIITTDVIPLAELVTENKCGVVVKPNLKSFLSGVQKLYRHYDYFQKNAVKAVKDFSISRLEADYERIYQEVVKTKK